MATRCCSARCSAERRGFRRELDSWRHKLIHCVGFESILEGIYGPRLLHDLSIFDNCEPEATADWSTDARCSFCNLQIEKISDRLPDSPPHAETPPQGINTSDTLQCQADQFLHAVLHKKEFPESCDPIIPLAAQELMRKMIRQFAVEYAHKIQATENQNAITQTDPDGPLDLTLSRTTPCAQQDGVLDLSKKNTPSLNTQQRLSGCLETNEEESGTTEREESHEWRGTALEEVMTSLCTHHRVLLLHILQEMMSFLPKEERGAMANRRDVCGTAGTLRSERGGHCCRSGKSLSVLSRCVCPCTLGVCTRRSVCLCRKRNGFSGNSVTLGCADYYPRSQHTHNTDTAHTGCITHLRCHSPSPPPLSPKPHDAEGSRDPDMPELNTHTLNTQPPSLLPHSTHTNQTLTPETHTKPEPIRDLMDKFTGTLMEASERKWSIHTHTGDSVKACDDTHLTEIITTVLHSSSEKDYNLKELFEQHLATEKRSPQTRSQRRQEVMQAINRSHDQPATRRQSLQIKRDLARLEPVVSSKKKRKKHTMHNQSPDPSVSHTQGSDTPRSRAQSSHTQCPYTPISNAQSMDTPVSHSQSSVTTHTHTYSPETPLSHNQAPEMPFLHNQNPDTTNSQTLSPDTLTLDAQSLDMPSSLSQMQDTPTAHSNIPETCTEQAEPSGNVRSRRNIVRPQHLSSYVTEPRKMFFSACRPVKTNNTPTRGTDTAKTPSNPVTENPKTPPVSPTNLNLHKHKNSGPSPTERRLRVKTRRSENPPRSQSPLVTDTDDVNYTSPIKLMLISTTKNEDGVKYTLRAAQPHNNEESFDPCAESSWAQNTVRDKDKTIQAVSHEVTENMSTAEPDNTTDGLRECVDSTNDTEPTIKRGPGRPKKLKAPTEKAEKRPIGRPRKSKPVDTNTIPTEDTEKQSAEEVSSGEDGDKNLKITITYGRRKSRRMVCEGQVPTKQSKGIRDLTQSNNAEKNVQSTQAPASKNKDGFRLVMPAEDRKSLTHSIMCPKQNDGAGTRKPGRPAKLKISGISVTVTTISPRRRKIHMKRDVRESPVRRRALTTEPEPTEKQETITEEKQASVRHSVRERRPSVHLLRCVSMSPPNIPAPRPRKLLMNKADERQHETKRHESKDVNDTNTGPNTSPQDAVHLSAASVESLFDASLQWWPTSASPETLKQEMNRRLKVIKETWVSDTSDVNTSDEDNSSAPSLSVVRKLFEQDCSMDTLSSWFMQTTETQSLSIVKKANNRNPCEVFQYSSIQASDRPNVCSSPQAERLRKCIKKFATVVPKSPIKLWRAQAKIYGTQNNFSKRNLFNTTHNDTDRSQQCGTWHIYRTALDQARSRFKSRTKNTNVDYKSLNEQEESGIQPVRVSEHSLLNTVQSKSHRTSAHEQITTNAWSPHTLRECKVFLRKLNSANTRSPSEESKDCTVRFSILPAPGKSVQHRERAARKSIKLEKMSTPGTSTRQQSKVNRKRRHSCTNVFPPSPKQQRSSRGVMAAKWSDFVLGLTR